MQAFWGEEGEVRGWAWVAVVMKGSDTPCP